MEKQKNVPQTGSPALRFPEFEGEWEEKSIEESIDFLSGFPFEGVSITDDSNGIPLMRGVNITEGYIRHSPEIDKYYSGDISKLSKYFLKEGDLVIGMDGSKVGRNSSLIDSLNSGSILVQRVARLRQKEASSLLFIYQHINSYRFHKYVDEVKTSSGIPHISASHIKDFKISFPSLPEQTKIANFLTAIDTKIQQLTQKKALLEEYKKGVMQQLFSQTIRFKDENGEDYPDWEEKPLSDITEIYDGTHMTPDYKEEGIPFYSVEHVTANNFTQTKFISQEVFERENKRVKLEKGDILMTRIGDIGTPKYIDWEVEASFYVSLALLKKTHFNNTKYLSQYIKTQDFQSELHKRIIHVAFPKKINLGEIGNCVVKLPSLAEQEKIADFLFKIDTKLETVAKQIEQTQAYKKGLLQQLFI